MNDAVVKDERDWGEVYFNGVEWWMRIKVSGWSSRSSGKLR